MNPLQTLQILLNGIKEHYPLCCIITFALNPTYAAKNRGIVIRHNLDDVYVPCRKHMKYAIPYSTYQQICLGRF